MVLSSLTVHLFLSRLGKALPLHVTTVFVCCQAGQGLSYTQKQLDVVVRETKVQLLYFHLQAKVKGMSLALGYCCAQQNRKRTSN